MDDRLLQVGPYVQALSVDLLSRLDELAAELAERVVAAEPLYRDERVVPHADLRHSCRNNLELGFSRLAGRPPANLDAPMDTGRRRAEQGMPLPATLRAYRIGGRFIWDVLLRSAGETPSDRDALLRASGEVWTIIDDYSENVGEGFREAVAEQSRRDTQVRTALLGALLDGNLADGPRLWDAAAALNLPAQGSFVVVVAETPPAGDQSLLRVEELLRRREVASVWRLETDLQVGVVSLPRRFTVDSLGGQLAAVAPGRVGISRIYPLLQATPGALREARVACSSAGPRARSVVRYDTEPVAVLLASAPEASADLAQAILGPVLALPDADRSLLLTTARCWLAVNASASAAAERLTVHRNTVRYRLRRVESMTGCDLTDPVAVGRLHLALESARIFDLEHGSIDKAGIATAR